VVGAAESQNELSGVLDLPRDHQVRVLFLEVVRTHQGGLVPDVFVALLELARKLEPDFVLDDFAVARSHRVPELRLPLVQKVDGRELHVLGVPAEEAFPRAEVAVGSVHSRQRELHALRQDGAQTVKFQLPELSSIRLSLMSAAYKGELKATFFQN
jgi:hypothetical protein